jgi:hypothetical protein
LRSDGCITLQASEGEEEAIAGSVANLPGRGAGYIRDPDDGSITRFQSLFSSKPARELPIVGLNRDLPPDQTMPSFVKVMGEFSQAKTPDNDRLMAILEEEQVSVDEFVAILNGKATVEQIREAQHARQKLVIQAEEEAKLLEASND